VLTLKDFQSLDPEDSLTPEDILNDGDIDAVVRKAIKLGLDPVRAIQLATINTDDYIERKMPSPSVTS
jgi:adenine deaminase